ncbi:uncharacterized protein [Eucyclogobius newberryi]|uniref:uncharacterized protein n=1 Tax=Eucyclogobius newberryi TaxID=166745 RepID=UPI003B5C890D
MSGHVVMSGHVLLCVWLFCLSLNSPLRVGAQTRVLTASRPVVVSAGDDVTLPCRCEPPVDLGPLTVEWSRTELKPDPSDHLNTVPFVHLYRERRDDQDMKIPEFVDRTLLFPERLAAGNASLQIRRVRPSDSGTYRCFLPNLRTERGLEKADVTLVVLESVTLNTDSGLDPGEKGKEKEEEKEAGPGEKEDQSNSTFTRLFTPTIVSFGIFCVGVLVVVVIKNIKSKCIWKTLQSKSDKVPPQSEKEDRGADRGAEPVKHLEEVKLLIPECSTDGVQRSEIPPG